MELLPLTFNEHHRRTGFLPFYIGDPVHPPFQNDGPGSGTPGAVLSPGNETSPPRACIPESQFHNRPSSASLRNSLAGLIGTWILPFV